MAVALELARRGLGRVWPNPAVGCVLVRAGQVVGRGWTQPGGRPHAETEALDRAGRRAQGATAYVSLEPCAHQGETPPVWKRLSERALLGVLLPLRILTRGLQVVASPGCSKLALSYKQAYLLTTPAN